MLTTFINTLMSAQTRALLRSVYNQTDAASGHAQCDRALNAPPTSCLRRVTQEVTTTSDIQALSDGQQRDHAPTGIHHAGGLDPVDDSPARGQAGSIRPASTSGDPAAASSPRRTAAAGAVVSSKLAVSWRWSRRRSATTVIPPGPVEKPIA
jgi:hypothetical protein